MRRKLQRTPLENLRRARSLTQADFARVVGVSQQQMSKYERGMFLPPPDLQERMATVLGSTRQDLFPESSEAVAS